ncbi:MAG TPA: SDR family NAD(P)-dependent oxidoreductase [Caulobacteraceae bacterium]|nr:SDR family NAD(P)-dependent oxidoreductase [Caulobacteraceae bacterium]
MHVDLSGKTALVTGASSGLGRHFAKLLAANGAHVIAAARRTELLDALVDEIRAAGGSAETVTLDVTDAAAVEAVIGGLAKLDILINNAGVPSGALAIDIPLEEWRQVFKVNAEGVFTVAQAAARRMRELGGGNIINTASITGFRPGPGTAAYGAAKAAIIRLTESLAAELARHRIRVNALAPGYIETDLNREFLQSDYAPQMIKRIPMRRLGELSDLDGPLLLLASDASAYMTGVTIPVDGGHLVSVL